MGRRSSSDRFSRDSGYDSPGAYMSGGLGYSTRRVPLSEDTLSELDQGHRKSKRYTDTVHPGDSVSQVGRPHFLKPGNCVEVAPASRRLEQYEHSSCRGSRADYAPTSPRSSSRRTSYASEHSDRRSRYSNKSSAYAEDPLEMRFSGSCHDTRYEYQNRYGDKASVHVYEAPVYERRSGYRDDRSMSSYRGDNGGLVEVLEEITPPSSSYSSNHRSSRVPGSASSARSSRVREDERRRDDDRKGYGDLSRASSNRDSHYEARRRSVQRQRYYQDNDRYGRYS
ncbi:hypothetical protein ASPVEDRAFT_26224 [Aspergillus versicolor CBS 583.65]|uniref:Uncharacterized protein n=1 Tax=Aspergillus versicolor CBS 583.65 TaxID=1036611 RepID=A0A1L9PD71_ASPVE|nr:uncharacterized protein ASPVEDRAFT_26224 [Aspergillus versicolor CBS 583.65]OJI99405.1 hypothetical protein ASPVEDRAFT_26224 [Aspergillus versicolor CBS 583.65]